MTEQEVFVLADIALNDVVAKIADVQWDMQMPPSFARRATAEVPTLRQIVGYHAYDDAWVPDMLAGKTIDEVGHDKYKGDLLGDDPKRAFAAIVEKACAAVRDFDDLDRIVHTSFGDFSARDYLLQTTYFRGLRAHDIAKVIGVDAAMSDDLVQGLFDEIKPVADQWREYGVMPPRVPVPDDAPPLARLLGLTGRDPKAS